MAAGGMSARVRVANATFLKKSEAAWVPRIVQTAVRRGWGEGGGVEEYEYSTHVQVRESLLSRSGPRGAVHIASPSL